MAARHVFGTGVFISLSLGNVSITELSGDTAATMQNGPEVEKKLN
jgi:hypothetical protein